MRISSNSYIHKLNIIPKDRARIDLKNNPGMYPYPSLSEGQKKANIDDLYEAQEEEDYFFYNKKGRVG